MGVKVAKSVTNAV